MDSGIYGVMAAIAQFLETFAVRRDLVSLLHFRSSVLEPDFDPFLRHVQLLAKTPSFHADDVRVSFEFLFQADALIFCKRRALSWLLVALRVT